MATRTLIVVVIAVALLAAVWVISRSRGLPPVTVTLRIGVLPKEESEFVAGEASSAKFKYLMGKQSGVKPTLAQKLEVKHVPNSPQIEAKLKVLTTEDGQHYAAAFVQTLQFLCGTQAQVTLTDQVIR